MHRICAPVACLTLLTLLLIDGCAAQSTADTTLRTELMTPAPVGEQPVVSLQNIISPASPMAGNYPEQSSGMYAGYGEIYWMDNHRIIFWTYEPGRKAQDVINRDLAQLLGPRSADKYHLYTSPVEIIKIWDVNRGVIITYQAGRVACYQNGIIDRSVKVGHSIQFISGPIGHEIPIDRKQNQRRYMFVGDCGYKADPETKNFIDTHRDKLVIPLRRKDGFIVLGERDRRTLAADPQNYITFYPVGRSPIKLDMYNNYEVYALPRYRYSSFANAYIFGNEKMVVAKTSTAKIESVASKMPPGYVPKIHLLKHDGSLVGVKVPETILDSIGATGIFLSKRGIVWTNDAFLGGKPGIYLSRGEQVRRIAPDSVVAGAVSPDGCRFAYVEQERDQYRLQGVLKVIDLCEAN